MNVKHSMNPAHSSAPIQSMPSRGMCRGVCTGRTSISTITIMRVSKPVMIHCMASHCMWNAEYIEAMPLSWITLSTTM